MLIVVDPHSGVPVYRQIIDQVKFHVASGLLQPGDELPSTRNLAAELGVNPMTVSKAYSWMERDGVIERRPGLPLAVRQAPQASLKSQRLEQLRASLAPAATMVRQLGIEDEEALKAFRELLDGQPEGRRGQ